jgi:copper oxidase (laccase) domain-containing protein
VRLDDKYTIDIFKGLESYRRSLVKLSENKLSEVIKAYNAYHEKYQIHENRIIHMTAEEIKSWNH